MIKSKLAYLFVFCLLFFSCFYRQEIFILSSDEKLSIPFKIAEFFGKTERLNLSLNIDVVNSRDDLIKFLNLSKYAVILTDNSTTDKVLKLLPNWYRVCVIAEDKSGRKYYILVKRRLLLNKEKVIKLISLWNFGLYELKDPAVSKIFGGNDLQFKFLLCGKTLNEN